MSFSSKSSGHVSMIYKTRKTLLELLEERGYNTEGYNNFTIGEIGCMKDKLDLLLENRNNSKIFVVYCSVTFSKNYIEKTIEDLFTGKEDEQPILNNDDEVLFILDNEPNDTAIKTMNDFWDRERKYVSAISYARLKFNILKHTLVPKHIILNEVEVEEFKKKYNISKPSLELPEISRNDPVSIAIGLRPGQITEIHRSSKTSINTKYYRVCI